MNKYQIAAEAFKELGSKLGWITSAEGSAIGISIIQDAIEKAIQAWVCQDDAGISRETRDKIHKSRAAHATTAYLGAPAGDASKAKHTGRISATHANEPIICPYCQIEQETVGGFIAHLKLLHQPAHASEEMRKTWASVTAPNSLDNSVIVTDGLSPASEKE